MDVLRLLVLCLLLTGCARIKYVPVETVRTEKEYIDRVKVDSVHVRDSVMVLVKGDTVVRERWRVEYKDRLRVDTVSVQVRDTIPVPVPVEVIKHKIPGVMWWIIGILAVCSWPVIQKIIRWIK